MDQTNRSRLMNSKHLRIKLRKIYQPITSIGRDFLVEDRLMTPHFIMVVNQNGEQAMLVQ